MENILLLFAAVLIIYLVFILFQGIGGKLLGAEVEELGLFNGPEIFKFNLTKKTKFRLNLLPLGSYVKFSEGFDNINPFVKIVIIIIGLFSYISIALVGVGFEGLIDQTIRAYYQLYQGIFSPIAVGSEMIISLSIILKDVSFLKGLGILASKFLAFNILPFGTLYGGAFIVYILEVFGIKSEKFKERFMIFGLILVLIILIPWFVASIAFIYKSLT